MSTKALEAIDRILNRSADADEALRAVVGVLADEPGVAWAGIAFLEDEKLAVGPAAGAPDEAQRVRVPVAFRGAKVGELWVDGPADPVFLERVALLVSHHVLIGWDTRGEPWEP